MSDSNTPEIIDLPRSEYKIDGQLADSKEVVVHTPTEASKSFLKSLRNKVYDAKDFLGKVPFDEVLATGMMSGFGGIFGLATAAGVDVEVLGVTLNHASTAGEYAGLIGGTIAGGMLMHTEKIAEKLGEWKAKTQNKTNP